MICLHFLSSLVGYLVGVCRVYVVSDCVAEPSIWSRILHVGTTLNMFLTACSISCVGFIADKSSVVTPAMTCKPKSKEGLTQQNWFPDTG